MLKWLSVASNLNVIPAILIMDMFLREAVKNYLDSQVVNDVVLSSSEKQTNFKKFRETIEKKNGKLYHKVRTDTTLRVIPTPEEVDACLNEKHIGTFGRHLKDSQTLVKALSAAGYCYPASFAPEIKHLEIFQSD